jgi:glycosyltransferase involved in cell wall biosynthesis
MRALAVGNMYPPHSLGGYEQVWRSAMGHLRSQGHEVSVLTTDFRLEEMDAGSEPGVHRELRWYWRDHEFPRIGPRERVRLERHNQDVLGRHLDELRPDVVSWWAMGGMSLSLIERVRREGLPAVGFVHDHWMLYGPKVDAWQRLTRKAGPMRGALARATDLPARVQLGAAARWIFVSEEVRRAAQAKHSLPDTAVAHSGVDTDLFRPAPPEPWGWRLLYAGRLDPRKGVRTAVEALALLPTEATLLLAGAGEEGYRDELGRLARETRVGNREELRDAYAESDLVVFPVEWAEPWGLVPLEAMAVGRPVIATGAGGSGEYLRDGENCLLFEPGDAGALADAARRLATDDALRDRLRQGGLGTAARHTQRAFNEAVAAELEAARARG